MSKLVRDRVPGLFPTNVYRVLDASEHESALRDKLAEEVREVLHALAALHGLTPKELEVLWVRKAEEWSGFAGRVWLKGVNYAER